MKYHKFKKINKGDNPTIRVTFKSFLGIRKVRDVCKCPDLKNKWIFLDDGSSNNNCDPINHFHNNNEDEFIVNGE